MSKEYKYHLSFAEKIDRLNICQSKECFSGTDKFYYEIKDILHDIQIDLDSGIVVTAEMIRAIVVLTQSNLAIWLNEQSIRDGVGEMNDKETAQALTYTHRLNGNRSQAKGAIQNIIGGRIDPKLNCLAEGTAWSIKF